MSSDEEENNNEEEQEAWVRIQENTFTNWVNDKLRKFGVEITHLKRDFRDGVNLCKLVENLVDRSIGKVITKKNLNFYEASGNIALALNAIKEAGVRLVNIGAEDISGGNLKLILGMIWILIRHFQIGSQSKLPPKMMMLSWIKAVLHPHMDVGNFSRDWNDGVALRGIIEYCEPGTYPDWFNTNTSDWVENCRDAMETAERLFGIPLVVSPENFASENLDELSGMTYLSYFMAEDAPGYNATLNWVRTQIDPMSVDNFDKDWNDGQVVSALVHSLNGQIPDWPNVDTSNKTNTCQIAMDVSQQQLEVKPVIDAKDMVNPEVDHIGVMAYAAWHRHGRSIAPPAPPTPPPAPPTPPPLPVVAPVTFVSPIPTPPRSPTPSPEPEPAMPVVTVDIVDTWRVGTTTTITVDTSEEGSGDVTATAESPNGNMEDLDVSKIDDNTYHVSFTPSEKGQWSVAVMYDGIVVDDHARLVNVFDVSRAAIIKTSSDTMALNKQYAFDVDLLDVGLDSLDVQVVHNDDTVDYGISTSGVDRHTVTFLAEKGGIYTVLVYCGGVEIPGSPFDVTVQEYSDAFASGSGLFTAVTYKKADFEVDFSYDIGKKLDVAIIPPSGQELSTNVVNKDQGVVQVEYTPQEEGTHVITLTYDGLPLRTSPHNVSVRLSKVYIRNIEAEAYVGRKTMFQIDASEMSKGTVEIDSNLPVQHYDKIGDNIFEVTILPKKTGQHDLAIRYNNQVVEGSPFAIDVKRNGEV
ncbi:Filamin-C [Lamellibrachia satsuma]|nr:Filamin-C [Lamellibrachia satsuma]